MQFKFLSTFFNKFIVAGSKNKDLAVVAVIIFVLLMMIVPLPQSIVDSLITFNITVTVIVLMVVVYIDTPLKVISFPSILLLLALLRIGITVSTSRLVLLEANAGEIISTFGEFVVGGNLVVGVIIFVIITIINFIVITKGSERVAEVSARFSLDAMPGKQMAIDSDLRSGVVEVATAIKRRQELEIESKLYGAMDGAMKFVKGDAIASVLDILINLIGGVVIGIVQRGMTFSDAMHTYSILTIGDGLVQQIPALLVSLTAGLMITRVSDESNRQSLGSSVLQQLFTSSKALFSASILLFIFILIPGMPKLIIFIFLLVVLSVGFFLKHNAIVSSLSISTGKNQKDVEVIAKDSVKSVVNNWNLEPLILDFATDLKPLLDSINFKDKLMEVKGYIFADLGVEIPEIIIHYNDKLPSFNYQILVYEIPISTAILYVDHILLLDSNPDVISLFDSSDNMLNFADLGFKFNGIWIKNEYKFKCDDYKLSYLTAEQFIIKHIGYTLKQEAYEFFGIQEVKNILDKLEPYQDLIRELLRMLSLNQITEILQRLVREDISIRNFKVILDVMLEWSTRDKNSVFIVEMIRRSLGRYIAHKFSYGSSIIPCFLLDSGIEGMIRDAIRYEENGSYLEIAPNVVSQMLSSLNKLYINSKAHSTTVPCVIVTQLDIRRYVRSLIEKDFSYIQVLSLQELNNYAELNCIGILEV